MALKYTLVRQCLTNVTLHGAHDFDSARQIGSVSAASPSFAAYIGHQYTRIANTLTIT